MLRKTAYDRTACLSRAARAEKRGRPRKALPEYRAVLEHEPENNGVAGKLALALARTGQLQEARSQFAVCAERYEKQGFAEKALAVHRQATGFFPRDAELWLEIARLHRERGHAPDALRALLEGRSRCRRRRARPAAIRLLREALRLDPQHTAVGFDLARLLRRTGERDEARALYQAICARARGRSLRRARFALLRLYPNPRAAWLWLRAALLGR